MNVYDIALARILKSMTHSQMPLVSFNTDMHQIKKIIPTYYGFNALDDKNNIKGQYSEFSEKSLFSKNTYFKICDNITESIKFENIFVVLKILQNYPCVVLHPKCSIRYINDGFNNYTINQYGQLCIKHKSYPESEIDLSINSNFFSRLMSISKLDYHNEKCTDVFCNHYVLNSIISQLEKLSSLYEYEDFVYDFEWDLFDFLSSESDKIKDGEVFNFSLLLQDITVSRRNGKLFIRFNSNNCTHSITMYIDGPDSFNISYDINSKTLYEAVSGIYSNMDVLKGELDKLIEEKHEPDKTESLKIPMDSPLKIKLEKNKKNKKK